MKTWWGPWAQGAVRVPHTIRITPAIRGTASPVAHPVTSCASGLPASGEGRWAWHPAREYATGTHPGPAPRGRRTRRARGCHQGNRGRGGPPVGGRERWSGLVEDHVVPRRRGGHAPHGYIPSELAFGSPSRPVVRTYPEKCHTCQLAVLFPVFRSVAMVMGNSSEAVATPLVKSTSPGM